MTRLFIASLPEDQALLFIQLILMPKCYQDILQTKKLNIHYFNSLIKSKYRVYAFFKAVVLDSVQQNRSSNFIKVVNAVLLKCHFPKPAVVSAMIQLLQLEPNNSLFAVIGALLTKQMSLPEDLL
jgi:essential nuclear protein 1